MRKIEEILIVDDNVNVTVVRFNNIFVFLIRRLVTGSVDRVKRYAASLG